MDASLNALEQSEPGSTPQRIGLPRAWFAIPALVILAALAAGCRTYRFEGRRIREKRPDHGSWINVFLSSWKIEDTPYLSAHTHHPLP